MILRLKSLEINYIVKLCKIFLDFSKGKLVLSIICSVILPTVNDAKRLFNGKHSLDNITIKLTNSLNKIK